MPPVSFIHRPGTDPGPCNYYCDHRQCREQRLAASRGCRNCMKEIGFDRSYRETESGPVHAFECSEKA